MNICKHLQNIYLNELNSGNIVESVSENAFQKCELLILFKKNFNKKYENDGLTNIVSVSYEVDPHYPLGKIYFCEKHKHSLSAPG